MDQLTELAIKYKADKWGKHHYTPIYYDLFKEKQDKPITICELGIAEGASIKMWREFFPNARIFGADNDAARVELVNRSVPETKSIRCDQTVFEDLEDLMFLIGGIDIFIDDGSHKPEDQLSTALTIHPIIKYGGIYIIEDVSDPSILKKLPQAEALRVGDRYDDQLIIIKK